MIVRYHRWREESTRQEFVNQGTKRGRSGTPEAGAEVEGLHLTQECIFSLFKTRMIEIASKSAWRSSRLLMSDDNTSNLSRIIASTFCNFSPSCWVPNAIIALRNGSCHCGYFNLSFMASSRFETSSLKTWGSPTCC